MPRPLPVRGGWRSPEAELCFRHTLLRGAVGRYYIGHQSRRGRSKNNSSPVKLNKSFFVRRRAWRRGCDGKKFSFERELKTGCDYGCASTHLTRRSYRAASPYPARSRTNSRAASMSPVLSIVPATHCKFCSPSRYAITERRVRFASPSPALLTFMLRSKAEIATQVNYTNVVQSLMP